MNIFALGGTVTADQIWDFGSGMRDLVLAGSVTVNAETPLTIPAGSVVKADPGVGVWVSGILDANKHHSMTNLLEQLINLRMLGGEAVSDKLLLKDPALGALFKWD